MNLNISWEIIILIVAVMGHAFATVRWGASVSENLRTLKDALDRIDRELEKRDEQISALWKRLDAIRDMINRD